MSNVYPVILSGGSGTRLWPLSRQHYPKQFLPLVGEHTMLQATALRLPDYNPPIAVCNEAHRFILAEQLQGIQRSPTAIILEPVAKNTAPAIALAAFAALQQRPDAVLVVLAADHVIENVPLFQQKVAQGVALSETGALITFGIKPTYPETGFGYIQGASSTDLTEASAIKRFVEKPDLVTATEYLAQGDYFWNSGMFVFQARAYLAELEQHDPAMYTAVATAYDNAQADLDFVRVAKADFMACPAGSIDYQVMEKTDKGMVLPLSDVGWNDVGSFAALWQALDKDEQGNVNLGDVKNIDSTNCFVQSENQFIATVGVTDLVVIGTKDSILVADKARVQEVKSIVAYLEETQRSEHLLHREVHRPWGKYDSVDHGPRYQVKRITVKPGAALSTQKHYHRAEHWIVVSGTAMVEIAGQQQLLTENQSTYIPIGTVHRLSNPGKVDLKLIEVQSGSYLGEDDIVRLGE